MSRKLHSVVLAALSSIGILLLLAGTTIEAAPPQDPPRDCEAARLVEAVCVSLLPADALPHTNSNGASAASLVAAILGEPKLSEPDIPPPAHSGHPGSAAQPEIEVITLSNLMEHPNAPEQESPAFQSTPPPLHMGSEVMAQVQAVPIELTGIPMIRLAATERDDEGDEAYPEMPPAEEAEYEADEPAPASPAPAPPAPREPRPEITTPPIREARPLPVPEEGLTLAPQAPRATVPASQYRGDPLRKPVTIEFREMDLANVVALLAQQADINVIAGTDITGTVTASLKNIPLMEAMEIVLGMNGLGIIKEGSIYRIVPIQEAVAARRLTRLITLEKAKADEVKATLDTIVLGYHDSQAISVAANATTNLVVLAGPHDRVDELEQIARQLDIAEPVIPTVTRAIKLNYAEPDGIRTVVDGMLTKDIGMVEQDQRGRHIVVTDTPQVIEQIEQLIKDLDIPVKQVAIDAMIVDAVMRDSSQTGVDWLLNRIPNRNRRGQVIGSLHELGLDTSLGNIGADALDAGVLSVGILTGNWDFRGRIAAEVQSRNAEILANPVVVTVENKPAEISIVQEFPYQEITQTTQGPPVASTEFKPIGVTLQVTPRVTHDNDIIVEIDTKQSSISGITETGVPIEDKRQASTTLLTGNGRTIFIGGLRNVADRFDVSKLPVLGDIPIARIFFSQNDIEKIHTELLVFLTCNVVEKELPELSPDQRARHDKLDTVPEVPDSQRTLFRSMTHPEEMRDPAWKWRRSR